MKDESKIVVVVPLVGLLHPIKDEATVTQIFELTVRKLQNRCDILGLVDHVCIN